MDPDVLTTPAPVLDDTAVRGLVARTWGIAEAQVRRLDSERDLNILIDGSNVLKIANPAEDAAVVDMEVAAMNHLRRTQPDLPLPTTILSATGEAVTTVADDRGRGCLARMISMLPGRPLEGSEIITGLAEAIGATAARIAVGMQGFFHPAGGRAIGWDIRQLPLFAADTTYGELIQRVTPALQATAALPSWILHADVTLTNVLAENGEITGVIDFGDMHHTAVVCDLATTLASVLRNGAPRQAASPWELTAAVLDGYQRHRPLLPAEAEILGELVIARMVITALISARRLGDHPGNARYISQYDAANARALAELASFTPRELSHRIARLAGTAYAGMTADQDGSLAQRRAAVMGGPLSPLFYREPLQVVSGSGPWLVTADGEKYLDAYNNVAVVGHAHPAVTQAVARQLPILNTHSRYLHDGIVQLAERIVATMPDGLDTCLFTTSGTEANELAWRLATACTGGSGAIIAEHAYHGSTGWMADLSSNEWPAGYRPAQVATFEAPRGLAADCDESVAAERIAGAARTLAEQGDRAALVLADSMFTSEGVLDAPGAFLRGLAAGAHQAGALYLADEVQAGYGRSGPQLWRFALSGVVPDLVSLGKPMGAGYPIGALVTRREIANSLARDYEYFSTFAATPAAAAAGLAVLDVLSDRGIPARAVQVGDYLRRRLRELAAADPHLGEVRGTGLMAGIDLIPPAGAPARPWARGVLQALVQRRVLAGLTGPDGTVLKVRPPLIWLQEHVDLFLAALEQVLGEAAQ